MNMVWLLVPDRLLALGISKSTDVLTFSQTTISRVDGEWSKKGKKKYIYPVRGSCVAENASLMGEVSGEWADWF